MTPQEFQQINLALQQEWKNLAANLPAALRGWLKPPVIAFNATMRPWGRWLGHPVYTLELAVRLVEEHPWYAVMEVFKHEVAHQITQVCFNDSEDETSHGTRFQQVCDMLGANPAASGDFTPLDKRIFGNENETTALGTAKIKKLLQLATSENKFEAENALIKAQELAQKYQIDIHNNEISESAEYCTIGIGKILRRRSVVDNMLGTLLQEHYQVMSIWVPVPMLNLHCFGYQLHIHGTATAVKIAAYVHAWLTNYLAYHSNDGRHPGPRNSKRDYALGLLIGFSEKLSQNRVVSPEEQAIIKISSEELIKSFRREFPHVHHHGYGGNTFNQEQLEKGKQAGRNLHLPSGIERNNAKNILHLKDKN